MDLLEYAQQLIQQGNNSQQTNAHRVYLQSLVLPEIPVKTEIKPKTEPNNKQIQSKNSDTNLYLLIGGLILLLGSVLAIGYWLGKRKPTKNKLYFDEN
jgi:hypothetical protein